MSFRKIGSLLLVLALLLSLCACGKDEPAEDVEEAEETVSDRNNGGEEKEEEISPEELEQQRREENAARVTEQIAQIGAITLESAELLETAQAAYAALTPEAQAMVGNLDVLTAAQETYEGLLQVYYEDVNRNVYAKMGQDGTAYLPMDDGSVLELSGDLVDAVMTKDRAHILGLQRNGKLFRTTPEAPDERTVVAERVKAMETIRRTGITYTTVDGHLYRYTFADDQSVRLGNEDMTVYMNSRSLSLMCTSPDGGVWILPETEQQPITAGGSGAEALPRGVSPDGKTAAWTEKLSSGGCEIWVYEDGTSTRLDTYTGSKYDASVMFNYDGSQLCVVNTSTERLYLKNAGETAQLYWLPANASSASVFTAEGDFEDTRQPVEAVYVCAEKDGVSSLYYVNQSTSAQVASNVFNFQIAGGQLYYRTADHKLFTATLEGGQASGQLQLSSDCCAITPSEDGQSILIMEDHNDSHLGTICYWTVGQEAPVQISEKANRFYFPFLKFYIDRSVLSADGKTVFYYDNVVEESVDIYDVGDLMVWTPEGGSVCVEKGVFSGSAEQTRYLIESAEDFFYSKPVAGAEAQLGTQLLRRSGTETVEMIPSYCYSYDVEVEVTEEAPPEAPAQEVTNKELCRGTAIQKDTVYTVDGVCEFALHEYTTGEKIVKGYMQLAGAGLQADGDSTLLYFRATYTNLRPEEISRGSVLEDGELIYRQTYIYEGDCGSFDDIIPLGKSEVYLAFKVPKSVAESGEELIINLKFGGQWFHYIIPAA